MTHPVSQVDRDRAADLGEHIGFYARHEPHIVQAFAAHRIQALEEAAKVAEEYVQSCLQARGNAGAMNDRYAVYQYEAERLASEAITGMIRSLISTQEDGG